MANTERVELVHSLDRELIRDWVRQHNSPSDMLLREVPGRGEWWLEIAGIPVKGTSPGDALRYLASILEES